MELMKQVWRTAGTTVQELERYDQETDRIREKMAWASKLRTTRIEDMAYYLNIGIFLWSETPSRYNTAMECYIPIEMDPNDGLTQILCATGGEEKVQILLSAPTPPRGDISTLTNRGIQVRL
ncbi:hypothetical protein BS17DRAFT_585841 [Gyrodon lividus]|nr:hypothetical protein BS17DRAFT_585841 [Gyrodon lividus]